MRGWAERLYCRYLLWRIKRLRAKRDLLQRLATGRGQGHG